MPTTGFLTSYVSAFIMLCSVLLPMPLFAKDVITVVDSPYEENANHQYFVELVEFLVKKSTEKYGSATVRQLHDAENTHEGTLNLIRNGMLDISWAGTSQELEGSLLPVRIPLLGGLLGYRVSIIRQEDKQKFINASSDDFKNMVACQGSDWGDSDILEDNGFSVMRISRFDLMFKMLARGRCDYFPRAIFEGYNEAEVARKKYPNLIVMDDVLLHYSFPLYFFLRKDNTQLAARIRYALMRSIEDGSFKAFMKRHPLTEHIFPIKQWQHKRVINLHNKFLPANTPIDNPLFWIKFPA